MDAQTTTSGGLAGVVTDPSRAVVPNADVEIKDQIKGTTKSTKTDRQGGYGFFFLSPSRYVLTVTHAGFRTEKREVNVLLVTPVSVNVGLEIAKTSTSVRIDGRVRIMAETDPWYRRCPSSSAFTVRRPSTGG